MCIRDRATAGVYMRGTLGDEAASTLSKVGLGGVGQKGSVQSRATAKQQGSGDAMVAYSAPPSLEQMAPADGPGTFDERNHLVKLVVEGVEALMTVAAGGAASLHAVCMAGDPRSDPQAGGEHALALSAALNAARHCEAEGPGEPSGFLVVPGRAEGDRRARAVSYTHLTLPTNREV